MLAIDKLTLEYPLENGVYSALRGIDLNVAAGEFFTLLGPSGCGKTSCLRCVAGLETPSGGLIEIDGQPVYSRAMDLVVPPNRRDISMVFQSYAIWPHMTVSRNVSFPLEMIGLPKAERPRRIEEALTLVGLNALAERPATLLSGGQQQRVALARAVVKKAKLLLLDEPLSNLDAKLREQMRVELRELQQRLGTTTIYVTHDQEEALSMSDRIAMMREGEILEIGTPESLYFRPRHRFTAEFLGQTQFLPASPVGPEGESFLVDTPIGRLRAKGGGDVGERARTVAIRPEHFGFAEEAGSQVNSWPARIVSRKFSGKLVDYGVAVAGHEVLVQSTSGTWLDVDAEVRLTVPTERCVLLID